MSRSISIAYRPSHSTLLILALSLVAGLVGSPRAQAAGFAFFEPVQPPRPYQVMVHRGEAAQAPENTKPALERCIEDQLEWAEIDLRLTRDGRHILSHGASLVDSTGKAWEIKQHDWAELSNLDVGARFAPRYAGVHPLSFEDCLALCKGRLNLYLDCKDINPESLATEILAAGMAPQVVVYSDLKPLARVSKAAHGKIATMTKWHPRLGNAQWAVRNGLAAVEIDAPEVTGQATRDFHQAGIKVQVKVLGEWDTPAQWDRALAAGVDWFQTDLPEELLAHALGQRLPRRPVLISCHRGANHYAPENTLPAFAKAVKLGVDYVEFDVRPTSDGTYFLLHDSRLDRTTEGKGPIKEIPAAAAFKLSAGAKFAPQFAATRLPTLEQFMTEFAGQIGFYFDAKDIKPEDLAGFLQRHHMVERTVVYQSPQFIARLNEINPGIRGLAPLGKRTELAAILGICKPYAVDADWELLSGEMIAQCHAAGVKVFSDALGAHERIEDYQQAMDWGIDLIQTDYPLRVMRALELRLKAP